MNLVMEVKALYCQSYETIIEESDKINKKERFPYPWIWRPLLKYLHYINHSIDSNQPIDPSKCHDPFHRLKNQP